MSRRRRHRAYGLVALTVALALLLAGGLVFQTLRQQAIQRVDAVETARAGGDYRRVTYQGKTYRYNERITTLLFAGLDAEGAFESSTRFAEAPRADSVFLAALDEAKGRATVFMLDRDTMTPVHRYTLGGRDRGAFMDHLGYAWTYGDGGAASGESLCRAVSELLYGVPVRWYAAIGRAALPSLAEAIGAVEVIVPNDDLAGEGLSRGQRAVINVSNLELFVRYRDTGADFSNAGRMERQRAYLEAAMARIEVLLERSPEGFWDALTQAEGGALTNVARASYLDLAETLQRVDFAQADFFAPEGERRSADYDEFSPDETALLAKVMEVFYMEE